MNLYPQLGVAYYGTEHKGLLNRMESSYAQAITINQAYWAEADINNRFFVGDQTVWTDLYGNLPVNRRRMYQFNHIRPTVNMISGHQRRNRKSIICIPVENGDSDTADQFTKVFMWLNQRECVLETISDAFEGALVSGMNLLQVWLDFRSDPINGNIKIDNCAYNSFLIDPYFRKPDLSDCNFLWRRSYMTKLEAISLMPDHADAIAGLPVNESGTARDGKFQYMPEAYSMGYSNLLTYDEYYYRDFRKQKLLVDTETGESTEWKSDDNDKLEEFLAMYPQITLIESNVPTVKLAIIIEGRVFYDGPNPLGIDRYPFVPVYAYYNPQIPYFPDRVQGVVSNLRDSQYLYNRRKITELDILESQVNSGYIYKEDALVNPADVFLSGQGKGLALKASANMTDVQPIQAPQVPPSMLEISAGLAREIQAISGVNEELMGSALDDKAGVLSMLRQGAGLTTLAGLFDQLDRSQKLLGKIILETIQANFTPGKIQRIIEEQPTAQFYNKAFGTYDVAIEDGLNTSTQRQMQFAQMLQLREVGVPISTQDLLEAATIQGKNKIIENAVAQEQAQAQAQQMVQQMDMAEKQARIALAEGRGAADQALGVERLARVDENKALAVERVAEAEKDKEQALLNFVKAIKEIEEIDLSHLEKILNLNKIMEAKNESIKTDMTLQGLSSLS